MSSLEAPGESFPVEPSPLPPVPPPSPEPAFHQLTFTGTGGEYFRIWVINLALTILTLGIYSAWAKVRRLQYFDRHTRLAGVGFDYHGEPFALLKGRVVGLVLFGLYSAISYVQFQVAILILVVLAVMVPWLLARSMAFRMHNTSYRGIRLRFTGSMKSAYWVFLALPVLTLFSLFTLGPFWHHRIKRYQFANSSFGETPFEFLTGPGEFYISYVVAFATMAAIFVAMVVGIGIVSAVYMVANDQVGRPPGQPQLPAGLFVAILLTYVIAVLLAHSILTARLHNAVWSRTRLGKHRFICDISWARLFGVLFTNLVATVLTLGLFRPFAKVREARFFARAFVMQAAGPLDDMRAADSPDISAIGEEAVGFFDLDLGF